MKFYETPIKDLFYYEPLINYDDRGYFFESFHLENFFNAGVNKNLKFVQDNVSMSKRGVLRGLHLQKDPYSQGKLVKVVSGEIFDVAVDLRKSSPTFGSHFSLIMSHKNNFHFWIPPGFAHGFLALSDHAVINYKVTNFWNSEYDRTIMWNDPQLSINWPLDNLVLNISHKDQNGLLLKDFSDEL